MKRPRRKDAEAAIGAFLDEAVEDDVPFHLIPDGEHGWAFWVCEGDTTSYLHPDLDIEWYGTRYPDDDDGDAGDGEAT